MTVAATLVVEPFLKSLKVWAFTVSPVISSEKAAFTLADGKTPVAPLWGTVLLTLGGGGVRRGISGYEQVPSARDLSDVLSGGVHDVEVPDALGVGAVEGGEAGGVWPRGRRGRVGRLHHMARVRGGGPLGRLVLGVGYLALVGQGDRRRVVEAYVYVVDVIGASHVAQMRHLT